MKSKKKHKDADIQQNFLIGQLKQRTVEPTITYVTKRIDLRIMSGNVWYHRELAFVVVFPCSLSVFLSL